MGGSAERVVVVGESGADSGEGGRTQTGRVHLYRVGNPPHSSKVGDVVEEVATISGAYEVGKFGMVVREAAGDSGLLVR